MLRGLASGGISVLCQNKHILVLFDGGISDVRASRRDFVKVWGLWGKGACKYMFIDLPDATNLSSWCSMYTCVCMYVCMYVRTDANMQAFMDGCMYRCTSMRVVCMYIVSVRRYVRTYLGR